MAFQLASDMGAGAADIATLVPGVLEKLPDLRPSLQLEPEQARFRLFDSIATFFRSASTYSPLVIILEDLHWADRSSLLLWEFLCREISDARIMLIGTYRDVEIDRTHPLSQTLGALIREPHFKRIHLEGLTPEDVGRFVESNAGIGLAESPLELVYARTEGKPLFLNEIVRLRNQEAVASSEDWTTILPEGIRDVISRRLHRLSEQCHEVLTVASVVGREFSIGQMTVVLDNLTDERLMDVLEECLSTNIVEEVPNILGRYQFAHALIQESLAEELSTSRRLRLHARIAESLEQLYAPTPELHAAELVHDFFQAQTVLGTGKLLRYSLAAGEAALASNASEEALIQFERALAANEGNSAHGDGRIDAETAAILTGLGHAKVALDRRRDAISNLSRAFNYYADSEEISRAVAIAQNPHSASLISGMRHIIARSVELAPAGSLESGRVLSSHGHCLGLNIGNYESAQEAFGQALAIARDYKDTALELRVLANSANIVSGTFAGTLA